MNVVDHIHDFDISQAMLVQRCPICQDYFRWGQRGGALRCAHKFHKTCVARWLMREAKTTCPVCRTPVFTQRAWAQDPRAYPTTPRTPQPPRRQPVPLSPYGHGRPAQAPAQPFTFLGRTFNAPQQSADDGDDGQQEAARNPWDEPMTADQWMAAGGMFLGFVKSVLPPQVNERIGSFLTTPIVDLLKKD